MLKRKVYNERLNQEEIYRRRLMMKDENGGDAAIDVMISDIAIDKSR